MKVSLDACLFGALCDVHNAKQILDIGTGSGLLSLMLAQRCDAQIDAVEIEPQACLQAQQNFQNSPFASQIQTFKRAIQTFQDAHNFHKYDTIICNPPFFSNQLASQDSKRHIARHNNELSFKDLAKSIDHFLHPNGKTWLLLPPQEQQNFHTYAELRSLYLHQYIEILARKNKPSKLGIFVYGKSKCHSINEKSVTVYQANSSEYTQEFKGLLGDYYLKL